MSVFWFPTKGNAPARRGAHGATLAPLIQILLKVGRVRVSELFSFEVGFANGAHRAEMCRTTHLGRRVLLLLRKNHFNKEFCLQEKCKADDCRFRSISEARE